MWNGSHDILSKNIKEYQRISTNIKEYQRIPKNIEAAIVISKYLQNVASNIFYTRPVSSTVVIRITPNQEIGTLGSANVNSASVLAIDPSSISNNLAYLSIAYNAPQLYPSSNTLIASWNVNVTGVSPSFTISIDPLSIAAFSSSGQVAGSVLNNNFVVTVAVPEPSSALLVVLASAICFKRRRK